MFCAPEEKPPSDSEVALHITICDTGVGMDGCAAARAIRHCGKPDAETIPILAMTANAFDDDRQKSLSAGMNDYLSKPLDIPKLTEAIQKFLTTPPTTTGWWGKQTPPALCRGCLFWAYSGVIGQGRDCRYSGGKLIQGQKRVVLGGVIAAAHLWADEGHAVPHIEYIVGNQRVRVLRGADGAA